MSDYVLSDETRAKLKAVSTASVATALYKRGLRNQFIQGRAAGGAQAREHGRAGLHAPLYPGA